MGKNLARLAKKGKAEAPQKPTIAKPANKVAEEVKEPVVEIKVPSTDETVMSILDDITKLTGSSKTEVIEAVENIEELPTTMEKEATGWLQEQVELLTAENEQLRADIAQLNDYYNSNPNESQNGSFELRGVHNETNAGVINLFNEIQTNLMAMGINEQTGKPNLFIAPINFLNRMVAFFPFLENEKRFNF